MENKNVVQKVIERQGNSPRNIVSGSSQGNYPEKNFRAGAVSATIWKNHGKKENGEVTEYRTISLERKYTDRAGEWKSTNSFRVNDIPKAKVALEEAYKYLVLNEQNLFNGGK